MIVHEKQEAVNSASYRLKNEEGASTIVEATIYLPFCIIAIVALLYAVLFISVKANLQSTLQTALVYYKNQESDTYVYTFSEMLIDDTSTADIYMIDGPLNPYRVFLMKFKADSFKTFVGKLGGYMFFSDMSRVRVEAKKENYIISKRIVAVAEVKFKPAVSFSLALNRNDSGTRKITSSAIVVINDGDEVIRTTDLINDITGLDKTISEILEPIKNVYQKLHDYFM